jgi:radical SAM protein with 4Fe4S-binding SPASM domain
LNEDAGNAPVHLDIEMQDYCNQSCVMCPRNTNLHTNLSYSINDKHVIDLVRLKEVILESTKSGVMSLNFGAFSEPLIHSDLWELIEFSHANGIVDTRVITNGLLLNRWKNQVFDSGLVNLFISLDAFTAQTYEKIRGKGFDKVVANTLEIIEERTKRNSKLPIIRVSWVDMEVNREEKNAFIEYWKGLVDHVDVQNWSDFTNVPSKVDLNTPKIFECRSPWQRMSILANGDVLPCCDFNGRSLVLGNIKNESLTQIWQGEKLLEIRKELQSDGSPICSACQRGQGAPTGA